MSVRNWYRALILSLVLHTGVVVMVACRPRENSAPLIAGPAKTGVGISFVAAESSGLLLAEAEPPAPPAEPEPPSAEPETPAPAAAAAVPVPVITAASAVTAEVSNDRPATPNRPAAPSHPVPVKRATGRVAAKSGGESHAPAGSEGSTGSSGGGGRSGGGGAGGGGAGYVPPRFLVRYKPAYPQEARARRLEGTVVLLVSVDARGKVTAINLQQSCGYAVLDRAAQVAVRSWRFDPARQNGTAISAQVEVPVRFRFEERRAARTPALAANLPV